MQKLFNHKVDSKLMNTAFEIIRPYHDKYNEIPRIAYFTNDASNLLLWSHYANSH